MIPDNNQDRYPGDLLDTGVTQKDRQPFMLTFPYMANLKPLLNLTCMSLECGEKLEYVERRQMHRDDMLTSARLYHLV